MPGQVYAVASGKGGVGKTTTVVNLGVVLRRADHTVVLVDADLGMANLGTMVGVEGEATIHDVLAGEMSVEDALVEEAPGFAVLTGSGDLTAYPSADPRELRAILETLTESYDFVLVDTGAGMSHEDVLPLGLADRVLLVTTPEPTAIGDTRKTADLADLADGTVGGLVVTMADQSTDAAEVAREVGVELLGVIPFDAAVRQSTASGTPLEAVAPESPAAEAYRELASVLVGGLDEGVSPPATAESTEEAQAGQAVSTTDSGSAVSPDSSDDTAASQAPAASETGDPDAVEVEATATDEDARDIAGPAEAADDTADGEGQDVEETATTGDGGAAEDEPTGAETEPSPEPDEAGEDAEPGAGNDEPAPDNADDSEPADAADAETPAADETDSAEASADDPAEANDGDTDEADDDLDDYLEEFEDIEPEPSGGFFARLRRLFR